MCTKLFFKKYQQNHTQIQHVILTERFFVNQKINRDAKITRPNLKPETIMNVYSRTQFVLLRTFYYES